MRNMKKTIVIVLIAMIGIVETGLAYPQDWEGAIVTTATPTDSNWWLKGYVLQNGYKKHIEDSDSFDKIYNSNGKRYFGVDISVINSIPDATGVKYVSIMDNRGNVSITTPDIPATIVVRPQETQTVYPQEWEGAIVTKGYSSSEQNWWLKGYLLQGGYKHQIMDSDSFWKVYNSNGKRYYGNTGDMALESEIDDIPLGTEIRFNSIMDNSVSTPVSTTVVSAMTAVRQQETQTVYPIVTSTPVINDPNSWKPTQGQSCWSNGSNLGTCSGKVAKGVGGVVGQFVKGFFGGIFSSSP